MQSTVPSETDSLHDLRSLQAQNPLYVRCLESSSDARLMGICDTSERLALNSLTRLSCMYPGSQSWGMNLGAMASSVSLMGTMECQQLNTYMIPCVR